MIPAWCALAWIHASEPNGHRWLLAALAIVWAADTGAYFAGAQVRQAQAGAAHQPQQDAGKAWSAAWSPACCVGAGAARCSAGATPAQLPAVALVALVAVLFSVVGDLFESLLKRHAGVKDSGHLIPGHGGILDRIDSVLAALPVFALGKDVLGF